MNRQFKLGDSTKARAFHGSRASGQLLRLALEEALQSEDHVTLDFTGVGIVTQSFIDEVVGVLILEYGPEILQRLSFKSCNEDVQAVIRFVAASRSENFLSKQQTTIH